MHVFVPIEPRYTYEQARSFAEIISQVVIGERPELFTTPRSVAKRRKGRVYFDYLQISSAKTIAAPYVTTSIRRRAGRHAAGLGRSEKGAYAQNIQSDQRGRSIQASGGPVSAGPDKSAEAGARFEEAGRSAQELVGAEVEAHDHVAANRFVVYSRGFEPPSLRCFHGRQAELAVDIFREQVGIPNVTSDRRWRLARLPTRLPWSRRAAVPALPP